MVDQAAFGQHTAGDRGPLVEVEFVGLDVDAAQVGDLGHGGVCVGDELGEFAQNCFGPGDSGGPQRHADLVEVAQECLGQSGSDMPTTASRSSAPAESLARLAGS